MGYPVHSGTGKETEVSTIRTKNEISHKNKQEAKELEINGFLHNSRGTNKIDSTSSNTQQE